MVSHGPDVVWHHESRKKSVDYRFFGPRASTRCRVRVVLLSCLFFVGALVAFRILSATHASWVAVAFYIFVDIFGVVLVEQFWSLADSSYRTQEGRRWYGLVGTGGLVGGVFGSLVATLLLSYRLFKALGSLIIIALTHWTLVGEGVADLGWVTPLGCVIWAWVLVTLHRQYLVLVNPKDRTGE